MTQHACATGYGGAINARALQNHYSLETDA